MTKECLNNSSLHSWLTNMHLFFCCWQRWMASYFWDLCSETRGWQNFLSSWTRQTDRPT